MMIPAASIVIPLYNDADTIRSCLDALLKQSILSRLEIIVVDDGSTDDGPALVTQYPVVLIRQPNAGPAAARNTGARAARGEILLFLDADCVATPRWAEQMLAAFETNQIVAAMGGIESATHELLPQLIQTEIEERYTRLSHSPFIDFFASVAVAIRRQMFLDVGGFREDFRYSEDCELAYRIHQQGGKMVFVQADRVLHHHPTRWRDYFKMKFCRGLWRMRTYELFPGKMVADNWTPQTLKLQVMIAGCLPVLLALGFIYPLVMWLAAMLMVAGVAIGYAFLRDARARGGLRLAAWSVPLIYLRAFSLGSAMAWFLLTRKIKYV